MLVVFGCTNSVDDQLVRVHLSVRLLFQKDADDSKQFLSIHLHKLHPTVVNGFLFLFGRLLYKFARHDFIGVSMLAPQINFVRPATISSPALQCYPLKPFAVKPFEQFIDATHGLLTPPFCQAGL
jgi:hypothetical protein